MWSSSLRGRPAYLSDSDSDIDANTVAKPDDTETNDARLICEMDLSGRHETVEYRPNPWSIARINAASRPHPPNPVPSRTTAPTRPPPKPQPKPIVDAFKKQVKRDQLMVPGATKTGDNSIGAPGAGPAKHSPAEKARQGCQRVPARPERLDPLSSAHKLKPGPTIRAAEALTRQKPAHISTFSGQSTQPTHASASFKPRWNSGTHRAPQSSPVRVTAAVGRAVGDRPAMTHSSPGASSRSAHIMRPPLPPPVSVLASKHPRPTSNLPSASDTAQKMPPSWLLNALEQRMRDVSPPPQALPLVPRPEPRQDATNPPHIRTPEPKRKRLASPEPTLPRKTRHVVLPTTSAPSSRLPTAYAFGQEDDPDAGWSTLARATRKIGPLAALKRDAKPKPKWNGVRHSGGFRLPGLGLGPKTTPTEVRCVVTYLPPPMPSKKLDNVEIDGGPRASDPAARIDKLASRIDPPTRGPAKRAETNAETRASEYHFQADEAVSRPKIDSPTRAPAKHAQIKSNVRQEVDEEEFEDIPVMDMTLVNEDEDDVAQIDVDDVCKQYPTTQAYMKAAGRVRRVFGCVVEVQDGDVLLC